MTSIHKNYQMAREKTQDLVNITIDTSEVDAYSIAWGSAGLLLKSTRIISSRLKHTVVRNAGLPPVAAGYPWPNHASTVRKTKTRSNLKQLLRAIIALNTTDEFG